MCRLFGLAFFFVLTLLASSTDAADVWLSGVDPVARPSRAPGGPSDYMDLFRNDAPWFHAASHTGVFKTSTQWLARASDDDLVRMFGELRRRNIDLAFEALMLTGDGICGRGIEGYADAHLIDFVAKRVWQLGGELAYVAMDEPLWHGRHVSGSNACQSKITDLARDVAVKVAAIRRYFPHARIGDIEPLQGTGSQTWIDEITEWADAYCRAVGEPLSFVHTDINWAQPWELQLRLLRERLKGAGIQFGIIYNGDPTDQTGVAWARRAEERFAAVEADPDLTPEQAVLQTWMLYPSHMLPEDMKGTMTSLVNRYAASQTRLSLRRAGDRLTGQLTDSAAKPVANATLELSALDNGRARIVQERQLSGHVPPDASTAVFGLRLNIECACSGSADIGLGAIRYREAGTGVKVERLLAPTDEKSIIADRGHPILLNTRAFPVTATSPFSVTVPLRATPSSRDAGYVAIIFMNWGGREISRARILLTPGRVEEGTITTDAGGNFSITLNPGLRDTGPSYRVDYKGDDQHRLTTATLP